MNEPSFTCVVCRREIEMRWNPRGPGRTVAPVCRTCEQGYGARPPQAGTFMDRRKAVHISALAEALHVAAAHRKWGGPYGRA